MEWREGSLPEKRTGTPHQPWWIHYLFRLATPFQLHQHWNWPLSRVFRMWEEGSRSPRLSSNTEGIEHSHPTITKCGAACSQSIVSSENIHLYPTAFSLVLMLASVRSFQLSRQITVPPYMYTLSSTKKSWTVNLAVEGTSDLFLKLKLRSSLVLSNPRLFLSSPSLERRTNIGLYIIFLFHTHHEITYHPLIILSTQISSPAPGEPLRRYVQ